MSLVTTCPACTTTFKVVRDQLRISDGWVRCGRCSHVFDASLDVRALAGESPESPEAAAGTLDSPALEAAAVAPPTQAPAPALPEAEPASSGDDLAEQAVALEDVWNDFDEELFPTADAEVVTAVVSDGLDDEAIAAPFNHAETYAAPFANRSEWPDLSLGSGPPVGLIADEPWAQPKSRFRGDAPSDYPTLALKPGPMRSVAEMAPSLDLEDLVGQVRLQKALREVRVQSVKNARDQKSEQAGEEGVAPEETQGPAPMVMTASEPELVAAPTPSVPSFLRVAATPLFWRSVQGRWIAWLAMGGLGLLMLAQVVHRERDTLAASPSFLGTLVQRVCAVSGCELSALRRINEITIDGAAFTRDKTGDGYQLSFTLRNAASVALAMPAVELALLDTQEQAVVRRVLLPADFGAPAVLPARADRAASLPLVLSGADAAALPPIAGYRVVAFYP